MSERTTTHSLPVAVTVAALGIASFSGLDAVMKHLAAAIGAYNAMVWRSWAGVALAALVFLAMRAKRPTKAAMRIHVTRGAMGSVMGFLFFWGLARVPLAQGVALSFVAPLIALYLAAILLKEQIARRAVLASLLGFAGVLVILSAQMREQMGPDALWGAAAILVSAGLYAWNIILMRQQALAAKPVEIAFFTALVTSSCLLLPAPFLLEPPPLAQLPSILAAAVFGFGALMLLSWAYARAEAQYLAPVEYSAFVWAALFGILFFMEPIQPLTIVGTAMIVLACYLAARRTRPTDPATGV